MLKKILLSISMTCAVASAYAQEIGVEYTTEVQTDFEKSVNWANLLRLDASLPLWKKGRIDYASIHSFKTLSRPVADDWQVFSNIDNDNLAFGLAVLGYTHEFSDNASVFAGVRNVGEDYFTSDGTALFTNSSCGIFPTIAENFPLGNYPLSAMGIHARLGIDKHWTVQGSLYNGVARPMFGKGHGVFDIRPKHDGVFFMGDVNYKQSGKLPGTYFGGISLSDKVFSTVEIEGVETETTDDKANFAYWLYAEQTVFSRGGKSVDVLAQYSRNTVVDYGCKEYMALGLVCNGLVSGKFENYIGILANKAKYDFGNETVIELTYSMRLNKYMEAQPVFQRIWNSDGNFNVAMLRLNFAL